MSEATVGKSLDELTEDNARRVMSLARTGTQLAGLETHYLVKLLEGIAGEELTQTCRLAHELWVCEILDQAEAQQRVQRLMSPV